MDTLENVRNASWKQAKGEQEKYELVSDKEVIASLKRMSLYPRWELLYLPSGLFFINTINAKTADEAKNAAKEMILQKIELLAAM